MMITREYVQYYRWCLTEIEKDNAEDFAYVRRFEYMGAWVYLQFIEALHKEQRRAFSLALRRYRHNKRPETPQMELSEAESRLVASYFEFLRRPEVMQEAYQVTLKAPPDRPLTQAGLAKDVSSSPSHRFKECAITRNQSNVWVKHAYRGMTINTLIDIGGSPRKLTFSHALITMDGTKLIERTDPLGLRGLGGVRWYRPAADDGLRIAEMMAESLERFVSCVDFILDNKNK
jgi:hypothetical protein